MTDVYNSSDKVRYISQYGGTSRVTLYTQANINLDSAVDETKVGRWDWTRYRDSSARVFNVVSVYRPNLSGNYNSAYLQYLRDLLKNNDARCSRDVIFVDLSAHISDYIEKVDSVVVMGDWYENVKQNNITIF